MTGRVAKVGWLFWLKMKVLHCSVTWEATNLDGNSYFRKKEKSKYLILFLVSNDQILNLYFFKDVESFIFVTELSFSFKKFWENKLFNRSPKGFQHSYYFTSYFWGKVCLKFLFIQTASSEHVEHFLVPSVSCHHWYQRLYQGAKPVVLLYYILVIPSSWRSQWFALSGGSAVLLLPRLAKRLFPFDKILAESSLCATPPEHHPGCAKEAGVCGGAQLLRDRGRTGLLMVRAAQEPDVHRGMESSSQRRVSGTYVMRNIYSSQPDQQPPQCTGQSLEGLISS